jgi:hypothetical protein
VGEARLAEAARADDRDHARVGQQRAEPGDVAVAAAQRARVVAHAAADGAVERQQVAMGAAEPLAGVGAEPVEQVLAVGLVALERRPGPAHGGLAAQQVGEQRLVVGALGVRGLERGSAWACAPVRLEACARITRAVARSPAAARRSSASGSPRPPPRGQPVRERQRLAASVAARSASSSSAAAASRASAESRTLSTSAGSTPSR